MPAVIALHDATGIDPRGWRYAEQLTAAGIAVLHLELHDTSADDAGPATEDDDTAALVRLAAAAGVLAEDPRFDGLRLGILAFGRARPPSPLSPGRLTASTGAAGTRQRIPDGAR